MRECLICGSREHVQSCEKIQLCTRCAGVLWDVLYPKLHPEKAQRSTPEEKILQIQKKV